MLNWSQDMHKLAARREEALRVHPLFVDGLPAPRKQLPTDWYFIERNMQLLDATTMVCPSLGIRADIPYEVELAFQQWAEWRAMPGRSAIEPMERVVVILGLMLRHYELGYARYEPVTH